MQTRELGERIKSAESEVKRLVENSEQHPDSNDRGSPSHMEEGRNESYDAYEHLDDESDDASTFEDRFRQLEEEVALLIAGTSSGWVNTTFCFSAYSTSDVHDLALYSKLCFTGFIK